MVVEGERAHCIISTLKALKRAVLSISIYQTSAGWIKLSLKKYRRHKQHV
jgi:hypothetical protein